MQINEHKIRFLYEAWGQINNQDEIVNEIVNAFLKTINNRDPHDKKINYKLTAGNNEVITCDYFLFYGGVNSTYVGYLPITFHVYVIKNGRDSQLIRSAGLVYALNTIWNSNGSYHYGLELSVPMYNGNFDGRHLRGKIAHEMTHFFQNKFNKVTHSFQEEEGHNKSYNNLHDFIVKNKGNLGYGIATCLYLFMKNELSANINTLGGQLKDNGINAGNRNEILQNCPIYKNYIETINWFYNAISKAGVEWDEIRIKLQGAGMFDKNSSMNTAETGQQFKKAFSYHIMRKIDYFYRSVDRCVTRITGKNEKT
jgi:hypothetical protein